MFEFSTFIESRGSLGNQRFLCSDLCDKVNRMDPAHIYAYMACPKSTDGQCGKYLKARAQTAAEEHQATVEV